MSDVLPTDSQQEIPNEYRLLPSRQEQPGVTNAGRIAVPGITDEQPGHGQRGFPRQVPDRFQLNQPEPVIGPYDLIPNRNATEGRVDLALGDPAMEGYRASGVDIDICAIANLQESATGLEKDADLPRTFIGVVNGRPVEFRSSYELKNGVRCKKIEIFQMKKRKPSRKDQRSESERSSFKNENYERDESGPRLLVTLEDRRGDKQYSLARIDFYDRPFTRDGRQVGKPVIQNLPPNEKARIVRSMIPTQLDIYDTANLIKINRLEAERERVKNEIDRNAKREFERLQRELASAKLVNEARKVSCAVAIAKDPQNKILWDAFLQESNAKTEKLEQMVLKKDIYAPVRRVTASADKIRDVVTMTHRKYDGSGLPAYFTDSGFRGEVREPVRERQEVPVAPRRGVPNPLTGHVGNGASVAGQAPRTASPNGRSPIAAHPSVQGSSANRNPANSSTEGRVDSDDVFQFMPLKDAIKTMSEQVERWQSAPEFKKVGGEFTTSHEFNNYLKSIAVISEDGRPSQHESKLSKDMRAFLEDQRRMNRANLNLAYIKLREKAKSLGLEVEQKRTQSHIGTVGSGGQVASGDGPSKTDLRVEKGRQFSGRSSTPSSNNFSYDKLVYEGQSERSRRISQVNEYSTQLRNGLINPKGDWKFSKEFNIFSGADQAFRNNPTGNETYRDYIMAASALYRKFPPPVIATQAAV